MAKLEANKGRDFLGVSRVKSETEKSWQGHSVSGTPVSEVSLPSGRRMQFTLSWALTKIISPGTEFNTIERAWKEEALERERASL